MEPDDLPLAGIKVVDFTNGLAGPLAAMVLADLGAEVVKVELIGRGDLTRDLVPSMFLTANRNKRSIAVDLKHPSGLEVARRLVQASDVLVESFRPGIMASLGLDRNELCRTQPTLVYAAVSGFGSDAPDAGRRAVDAVAQAEAGMIATNDGTEAPFTVVDISAGLQLAQGVLAALVRRATTGRGGVVEANLVAAALGLQAVQLADLVLNGTTLTPRERARRAPTAGVFEASDGAVYVAAHYDEHWRALAEELGAGGLVDDPRFSSRDARIANGAELKELLAARFLTATRATWQQRLDARGVMVAAVRSHGEVLADEGLVERGWIVPSSPVPLVALPYSFDGSTFPIRSVAPRLGAHSLDVLAELGYSESASRAMVDEGVVQDGRHDSNGGAS